jgi:hypothetical protein
MENHMKRIFLPGIIIFLMHATLIAQDNLGKVVSITGDVDITSVSTGKKFVPDIGTPITSDYKIRTGNKSYIELLLSDGTKIFVREVSVLNITSLKLHESDPPTKLGMLTGKVRITLKKTFKSNALVLRTPTTIAGVRGTDFGAIATRDETRLVVFEGKVEVANARKEIVKSYMVQPKEEVSIKKDTPPTEPKIVPQEILHTWFDYYDIDERNRIIIRKKKEEGFLDNLLRKKEF